MKNMSRNDVYELAGQCGILKIPYCDAQSILRGAERIGYNAGVYGWNYDVYMCGDVVVLTGYRIPVRGYKADSELLKKLEESARKTPLYSWVDAILDIDCLFVDAVTRGLFK